MKRTLRELLEQFNYDKIKLVLGQHEIMIDINKQGSFAIIKAFQDKKFTYRGVYQDYLLLEY